MGSGKSLITNILKDRKKIKKIDLDFEISEMSNFTDFVDFYFNNFWKFAVSKDFFNLDFNEKFVEKNTFQ